MGPPVRFVILAPDPRHPRRFQAENPLIGLSDFAEPPLIAAANTWLPGFITDYNKRFGRAPVNGKDLHGLRQLTISMRSWLGGRRGR